MEQEGRGGDKARSPRHEVRRYMAPSGQNGRRSKLDVLRASAPGGFVGFKGHPGAEISASACFKRGRRICRKTDRRGRESRKYVVRSRHSREPSKSFITYILVYLLLL